MRRRRTRKTASSGYQFADEVGGKHITDIGPGNYPEPGDLIEQAGIIYTVTSIEDRTIEMTGPNGNIYRSYINEKGWPSQIRWHRNATRKVASNSACDHCGRDVEVLCDSCAAKAGVLYAKNGARMGARALTIDGKNEEADFDVVFEAYLTAERTGYGAPFVDRALRLVREYADAWGYSVEDVRAFLQDAKFTRGASRKVAQWPSRVTGYCVTGDHDSCSGVVYYDAGQWNHDVEGPCQCSCHGTTGSRKVAHDSGDGERIFHCPFCGAGQVVGNSDGTAQCQFCDTTFTVQVQPSMPGVPQTIDGEPHVHPEMPGSVPGEYEEDPEPEEGTEILELEEDEKDGSMDNATENPFTKQEKRYRVGNVSLSEEDFMRRLAILYADDRTQVIKAVRKSREG